jgi:nucleoid-associated protein YgaU
MQTTWGGPISGDSYTVVKGDWLSTIAARAYGDVMLYNKIAQANNISNPNIIEVGTVLKIPRD